MISGLAGLIALLIGWETSGRRLDCHAAVDRNLHPGCAGRSRIAWPDRGGHFSSRTARLPGLLILMLDEKLSIKLKDVFGRLKEIIS